MLHQLEGGQAIEEGEGALAHVALDRGLPVHSTHFLVADGRLDGLTVGPAHGVEVGQVFQWFEAAVGVHAAGALQLEGEVTLQQPAALDDGIIKLVA
jgi:hypothetical protein